MDELDFVEYYADAVTGEPDSWYFHGMKASFLVWNYTTASSNKSANKNNRSSSSSLVDPALFVPPECCF